MDLQQKTRRFGMYVILCALVLRLCTSGWPEKAAALLLDTAPIPTYSETGRNVRFSASSEGFLPHFRESPAPWVSEPELPRFVAEDAELVELYNTSTRRPEPATLLEQPLSWDLRKEPPAVLILHTHTTESYTQSEESYVATASYRTLEEDRNMLSIGDAVAEILEDAGITVIHDRQFHDHPAYNGSYTRARKSISEYLTQYPSIRLVLDLHRDASGSGGRQLRTEAEVDGEKSAQLMLVMGTNYDGWEQNLSLALKLHVQLERQCPGIMRPLSLRAQRFNQDLSPGALLVEVGAAGNTRQEALLAARELAKAVVTLAEGTAS